MIYEVYKTHNHFDFAFVVSASAQKNRSAKPQPLKLNSSDKIEIIDQMFDDGFEKLMDNDEHPSFLTCLIPIVEDDQVIFVSTEFDKKFVQPQFTGYRFIVMSVDEMRKQVEKERGECYFRISHLIVEGSEVKVTLARYINLPAFIYGTGFRYGFTKVNGKWEKRLLGKYTMVS